MDKYLEIIRSGIEVQRLVRIDRYETLLRIGDDKTGPVDPEALAYTAQVCEFTAQPIEQAIKGAPEFSKIRDLIAQAFGIAHAHAADTACHFIVYLLGLFDPAVAAKALSCDPDGNSVNGDSVEKWTTVLNGVCDSVIQSADDSHKMALDLAVIEYAAFLAQLEQAVSDHSV